MTWRTGCILALILLSVLPSLGDPSPDGALTPAEYGAQLDRLIAATGQPDISGSQIADMLRRLPPVWRVSYEQRKFEVSTEWLRNDLLSNSTDHINPELIQADHKKLISLRADLDAFQKAPSDVSAQRSRLTSILATREFSDIHGITWRDRLKRRLVMFIYNLLRRAFRSSSLPTVGKTFVYCLLGIAVLAVAFWVYRKIRADNEIERIIPETLAVSAKDWALWMAEAREAANQGNWRDAIHLAYWAGISFLESQGTWRPDRARTPREYLRLMPERSERHSTLVALTRSFEVVWYGKREADSQAFSQTLIELEKLGCHLS